VKRPKAAALKYEPGDDAPKVVARGEGLAAEALLKIARESGIPIIEVPGLAESLSGLDPFSLIPERYWSAVAEILSFVYAQEGNDELYKSRKT
jgi:flagellar biosynthesis protein